MKKSTNNIEQLNNHIILKSRNTYESSLEKNKKNKIEADIDQNKNIHIRNKTEPILNKISNIDIEKVSKYFEKSLIILNLIQHNLTMSAENNNKPLLKKFHKINNKKLKKLNKYIKLSSQEKFDMAKNIIDNSSIRKETYIKMFSMINSSVEEVKKLLVLDFKEDMSKNKLKELYPFQDDISSITVYNCSENEINESKILTETPKNNQNKNLSQISKTDQSSTIYNDDSYYENKNDVQIKCFPIQKINSNLNSVVSTSNTNPNIIVDTQEKIKNKAIFTEVSNNCCENKRINKLEKINDSKKYSKDDINQNDNNKKDCNIF